MKVKINMKRNEEHHIETSSTAGNKTSDTAAFKLGALLNVDLDANLINQMNHQ